MMEAVLPLSMILLPSIILLIVSDDISRFYPLLAFVVIDLIVFTSRDVRSLWRSRIDIGPESISGWLPGGEFNYLWSEVVAVWRTEGVVESSLNVSTRDRSGSIGLKPFDKEGVWSAVLLYARPEALRPGAYKNVPGYRKWLEESANIIKGSDEPLSVGVRAIRVVGGAVVILFLSASVACLAAGQTVAALLGLPLAAVGVALLLSEGPIEISSDSITGITPLGRYRIKWDEVISVETDHLHNGYVLNGPDKRLVIPGPGWWSGKDKRRMIDYFFARIEQKGIEIRETQKALWKMSRNTKVRRDRVQAF